MFPKGTDLMLYKIVFNAKALLLIFGRLLKNALYTAGPLVILIASPLATRKT